MGEIIALLTTLSWSIGIFPFTAAARRLGPTAVNQFRLVLAVVLLMMGSFFFFSLSPADLFVLPATEHWLWYGMSGIIGLALGDYFAFTSFAILGARMGSIFMTLSPGAALLTGLILLPDERLDIIGITGMMVTVSGVLLVVLSKKEKAEIRDHGHGSILKGIIFGVLSALCQGAGLVMSKKGQEFLVVGDKLEAIHEAWIRMIVATAVIIFVALMNKKFYKTLVPIIRNHNNGVPFAIAGTIFGPVLGVTLSMFAISLTAATVAQTIFSLVPVVVMFMGFLFLQEKISLKSLLGAIIAIGGVMMLIWREQIAERLS